MIDFHQWYRRVFLDGIEITTPSTRVSPFVLAQPLKSKKPQDILFLKGLLRIYLLLGL